MRLEVLPEAEAVARRAAGLLAAEARASVARNGRAVLATSGGSTPWRMLRLLADEDVPWSHIHLFQVDERAAPADHPDRNLGHLRESLLGHVLLPEGHLHAMPVDAPDLTAAAARYEAELHAFAGTPAVLDLVHLGLGADGHTASLVSGDPALEVEDADVAVTCPYRGWRRMTLTRSALARARSIVWVVTGADKAVALSKLRRGDDSIPAGRISVANAVIFADEAAAGSQATT